MTPAVRVRPLVDRPQPVPVGAIERELGDLLRTAAEQLGRPVTRARTITLVAFAPGPAEGERLIEVMARTSERHPARAIILMVDPGAPDLQAAVAAHGTAVGAERQQVVSEQIILRAPRQALGRLISLVRHLVLPDMPVYLYWPAPVTWDGLLLELLDLADRLVLDSAAFPDGAAGLADVARVVSAPAAPVAVSDLSWGRLTVWRGVTAHFFDPPHAGYLDRIERVRLTHAASSRVQALLYVGWLAGRLLWRVREPFTPEAEVWRAVLADPQGDPVTVALHPDATSRLPAGALLLALIVAAGGQATFSIAGTEDRRALLASVTLEDGWTSRRLVPLDAPDEVSLLSAELDVHGHDRVYEESLRALLPLLEPAARRRSGEESTG